MSFIPIIKHVSYLLKCPNVRLLLQCHVHKNYRGVVTLCWRHDDVGAGLEHHSGDRLLVDAGDVTVGHHAAVFTEVLLSRWITRMLQVIISKILVDIISLKSLKWGKEKGDYQLNALLSPAAEGLSNESFTFTKTTCRREYRNNVAC